MRCLADMLDIVDDCNVLVPCGRGYAQKPPELAKSGARQFIGHAVGCVPRNQVDLRGDACPRSRQHGLQGIPAVLRKVSEVDVETHHSTGGISRGQK